MSFDPTHTIEHAKHRIEHALDGQILESPAGSVARLLDSFDMMLALEESVINRELAGLVADGTIKSEIVLYRTLDAGDVYRYTVVDSAGQVPAGAEYIQGRIVPSIRIQHSGSQLVLVLDFQSGTARFADKGGFGPLAKVETYDMTGWQYGVAVDLDLTAWTPGGNKQASKRIAGQLEHLRSSDLEISCLFLDFASSELETADPALSTAPAEMQRFMASYFGNLDKTANPYILGYSASSAAGAGFSAKIPPSLRPTGTTYAVTLGSDAAGPSSLDYAMVTAGGHQRITSSPPPLATSGLVAGDHNIGKLSISHAVLLEALVFQPLYQRLQTGVYAQVSNRVSVSRGLPYSAGRIRNGDTWSFVIARDHDGDNQYSNTFTATLSNTPEGAHIAFQGRVRIYKTVSKKHKAKVKAGPVHVEKTICTAHAHASASADWSGTATLSIEDGALRLSSAFHKGGHDGSSSQDNCAKYFNLIDRVTDVRGVLDAWTGNGLLDLLSMDAPGLGSIDLDLQTMTRQLPNLILLPTGSVYQLVSSASSPAFDAFGNLHIDLTYKG